MTKFVACAFCTSLLSAAAVLQLFSLERLKPSAHFPFYKLLRHLFVMSMAKAEEGTTPVTVTRLIEAHQKSTEGPTLVMLSMSYKWLWVLL